MFEIEPKVGALPVRLGMNLDQVCAVLGEFSGPPGERYFFDGAVLVNFVRENQVADDVTYIEVRRLPGIRVMYKGVSLFEAAAHEVEQVVCGREVASDEDTCTNFDLDLGLWRDFEEDSLLSGDDPSKAGWPWLTIGVGPGGYFR